MATESRRLKYAGPSEDNASLLGTVYTVGSGVTLTQDLDLNQLLTEVLKELKIANLHNSVLSDNVFQRTEVHV